MIGFGMPDGLDKYHIYCEKAGVFDAKYIINSAGLNALEIAASFGMGQKYDLLPIKGNYLISTHQMKQNTLVYPIPMNPVTLGVHSTITTDGFVKLGPSAFPALSPENYEKLQGVKP